MNSSLVDVAIGLILMYLVLSLLCTTLNELISTSLSWRSKSLSQAIIAMIDNPQLLAAFNDHGLINNSKIAARGGQAPNSSSAAVPGQNAPAPGAANDGTPKKLDYPSYLGGHTFAMALLDSLTATDKGKSADSTITKQFPTIAQIQQIVGDLPNSNIRDVLLASLASGKKDLDDVRDNLAHWFDTAMDRLSGDYKRWLKILSLVVAMAVAVIFNADSVSVSRALWKDPALRNSIVSTASQAVKEHPAACNDPDPGKQTACLIKQLKDDQDSIRPFPIGWTSEALNAFAGDIKAGDIKTVVWLVIMKVLGLIATGIALSLGAPFWFDLLQKFMNIRGSGPKPKKAAPAGT
jgi:hypothetical protein